jgi:hypothetical protein
VPLGNPARHDLTQCPHPSTIGRSPHRQSRAPSRGGFRPVGFQNSATGLDLGFYAARWYSWRRPPRTGWRLTRGREASPMGWPGRAGGVRGGDGAAVGGSAGHTRPRPAAGVVRRRSASGRSPPSGRCARTVPPQRSRAGFAAGSAPPRCRRGPGPRRTMRCTARPGRGPGTGSPRPAHRGTLRRLRICLNGERFRRAAGLGPMASRS